VPDSPDDTSSMMPAEKSIAMEPLQPAVVVGVESFGALVEQHQDRIYNFLRRMGLSEPDAEDITQDTFVKAFRALDRFQPVYSFSTWLFTIARRTAANHFRDRHATEELPEEIGGEHDDPSQALVKQDESQRLWREAKKLKPRLYEVLWLQYGEGLSIDETARVLNRSPLYVRVSLHRARNQLAKILRRNSL
jgi:RNA polymerase sigma-70 factor, ECF subfamily